MNPTGAELAGHEAPARAVGVLASPAKQREADDLVRTIGLAIGDRVVPSDACGPLGVAIALMIVGHDGLTGYEIIARAYRRERDSPHIQRLLESNRSDIERSHGAETADAAIAEMKTLGREIFAALGDRVVPHPASDALAKVISLIADDKVGLWRSRPRPS